ncbi:MAG: ATP-binding protein [Thermodesulfobacteriota bacterium]
MKTKRLLWHIYPPLVLIIIVSLAATAWYASNSLRNFFLEQTEDNLKTRAGFILNEIEEPFAQGQLDLLNELCRSIDNESTTRITVILPSGKVVADSEELAEKMDNHADRVEIGQALTGQTGSSIRYSHTLQKNMLYVAIPIYGRRSVDTEIADPTGVLRLSIPVTAIDNILRQVYLRIMLGSIFLIIVAALITLGVSRRISRPIERIRQSAERFAQGDLTRKIIFSRDKNISSELVELAEAMNKMSSQLDSRIKMITEQRNKLEAIFAGMIEAVLLIDVDEKFLGANKAAIALLGLEAIVPEGRPVVELVRHPDLLQFIRKALSVSTTIEGELNFNEPDRELFFQAYGSSLLGSNEKRIGCLVVLHDVTKLRRLERVRSDFVANVSHELKTPITTIKGFAETLKDGALQDPEATEKFVDIILKNSNRLNSIVDDLLALSRIEQEDENQLIELAKSSVCKIIDDSVEDCSPRAEEKNMLIQVDCPTNLTAEINSPLLQQAIVNLLVNAIKYSNPGSEIKITGSKDVSTVLIRVEDFGTGIANKHLPRLFERFYRSDKARSRKLGGTGLGLAIVKHIVQAHHGEVKVTSILGKGTVFTIKLPAA